MQRRNLVKPKNYHKKFLISEVFYVTIRLMFRATRSLCVKTDKFASDLTDTLLKPRGNLEIFSLFLKSSMSILQNPKQFEDLLQRRLIRPEITKFGLSFASPIVLFNDIRSFYNDDGKAKYDGLVLDEKFVEGARGALENVSKVQWEIFNSIEKERIAKWEKSRMSNSKEAPHVLQRRKRKTKKLSKALLRTLHRRRRILSERSNQGSFDQSYEDDFNWEEIAEEDPESFQAQLRCMTSTSLFKQLETRMSDMFMHHKSDVLSGGENEDFLIATTCDDVEVNDCALVSARAELQAPVEKLLNEGELQGEDIYQEAGWPIVAEVEVIYDVTRSFSIRPQGNKYSEIVMKVFGKDGNNNVKPYTTNDVMVAVFNGVILDTNKPLRWKLASIRSVFLPMQLL